MKLKRIISGLLLGLALGFGFVPIFLMSLIENKNMFIEIIDRLNDYWDKDVL